MSTENALAVLSQTALNQSQIKAILIQKGLKGEELELAMATLAQDAANKTATASTFSLTAALQGLKTAVLTNPLLMGAAVVAGLFAVYKVVDLLTVSFDEQKKIVEDLTSEVNDLQSEYDKLKTYPSVNGNKLSALKRELEIKKDILEVEKETLALKDMQENMPDISNKTGVSGGHVNPTWTPEDTAETDIRGDLQKLYQAREGLAKTQEKTDAFAKQMFEYHTNEETDALKSLSEHTNTLKTEYLEIAEAKAKLEQYVEDGTLKGVNADIARQKIAEYQAEIDRLDPIILEAELELGTASYLEAYNQLWDKIENDDSHRRSLDFDYVDIYVPTEELDNIVVKTKELNQEFLDGKQNATEYFDSISKLITDSGLEEGLSNLKGNDNDATDYLEQVVSGLSTQVSDSMMESAGRFIRGESSVQEYTDELESAAEAEMKLLKAFHKFETDANGQVKNFEDLDEAGKNAADTYNELENKLDDLREVDAMIEVNTNYADLISDYENWTEDMLDTEPIQNYVKEMSAAIAQYAKDNKDSIDTIVTDLTKATGVAIEKEKLLSTNAASYLQDVCGNSIVAVHGMVVYSTGETTKVVTNASQALGGVLEALGNMIENFEYTITATPKVVVDPKIEMDDNGVPHLQLGSYELKFSGKGGQSVKDFSTALKGAASYFENNDVFGERLNDVDSYKSNGMSGGNNVNNDTTIKNPTGKGGSSSKKDPHIAEVDAYKTLTDVVDEYDRKLEKLERIYDHTDNIEERIALKNEEIKLYQQQKDAIDELNKARDAEITDKVNKLRGVGFNIDYDPSTEQLIIHNREHINDLSQDIIETYEDYISTVDDLNDANKESADQWDELTYAIMDAADEIAELRFEQYEKYIEDQEHLIDLMANRKDAEGKDLYLYDNQMNSTLKTWLDLVKDGYDKNKDKIQELEKAWMDYYDARIEREKELLENQLDDNDDALDAIIKVIDDEIKGLDDQIDALQKINEERKESLELQKAQAELDKARNQKTRMVLRKGVGWVYEADEDAVRKAEEDLADKQYESKVDALEDEKEKLEELKEKWEEIPNIYQNEQNKLLMIEKLGADAEEDILDGRTDIFEKFKDDYIDIQEQIQDKTDELEEHTSEAYLSIVQGFEAIAKLAGLDDAFGNQKVPTQSTQSSWYVNKDGTAPSQAKIGDLVYTKGGTYKITAKDENGKFTSEKINNNSANIADNMWGKKFKEEIVDSASDVSYVAKEIVDKSEDIIQQAKNTILSESGLARIISNNTNLTDDEISAIFENVDITEMLSDETDDNTDATDENTRAILRFIEALQNLELEVPVEEMTLENFDDSIMSESDQAYVKELQRAWNLAMQQGNYELAEQIHAMADEARLRYLDDDLTNDFNKIAEDFAKLADSEYKYSHSVQIGGSNGDPSATQKYLDNLEWLRGKSEGYASQDFMDRLDDVEDAVRNGNGLTQTVYTDQYGRVSSVIDYADKVEEKESGKNTSSSNKDSGSKPKLNDSDSDAIKAAQKAYNEAKAKGDTEGMQKAHADAEAIRNKNGYSGGTDGSQYIVNSNSKVANSNDRNSDAVSDNSDANYANSDASDKNTDAVNKNTEEHAKGYKVDVNVNTTVSSGSSSYGSSKGSSGNNKGSSSGTYKMDNDPKSPTFGVKVKQYAIGGRNLVEDIYNVDEKGRELLIQPTQGRYVHLSAGSDVLPADITDVLWKFGQNPSGYIEGLNVDYGKSIKAAMVSSDVHNHYHIGNVEMHGVDDWIGFMNELQYLPSDATQHSYIR